MPPIGAGAALEVIVLVMLHPVGSVYVITDVPTFTPVTTPVLTSTEVLVLLLVHEPPPALLSAAVAPTHTVAGPEMAAGKGFTVTVALVLQPVEGSVYVILEVPRFKPAVTPVPKPIVATEVLLLLHVPPPTSESAEVDPLQIPKDPEIAAGEGFTVTMVIALQPEESE